LFRAKFREGRRRRRRREEGERERERETFSILKKSSLSFVIDKKNKTYLLSITRRRRRTKEGGHTHFKQF
jgi:hypothetical protein